MKISEMEVNKKYLILNNSSEGIFSKGDIILKNKENDIIWLKYSGWINVHDISSLIVNNVKLKELE